MSGPTGTTASNLLKNRFNSLALSTPPSAPPPLVCLNPVMDFTPLHTFFRSLFCRLYSSFLLYFSLAALILTLRST